MHAIENTRREPRNAIVLERADKGRSIEEVIKYAWDNGAARTYTVPSARDRYSVLVIGEGKIRVVDSQELQVILSTL